MNVMAREVDFGRLEPHGIPQMGPRGGHKTSFVFEPMRRKMHIPGSEP